MHKLIAIIILSILSNNLFARIGLADWSCKTPFGNEINNFNDYSLFLKNNKQVDGLSKWYFYKGFIIGELRDTLGFFTVNENSNEIKIFNTEDKWRYFIKSEKLKPKLWTRWYSKIWTFFNDRFVIGLFIGFYITIPLVLILIWIFYRSLFKEKFNIRKPFTIIVSILLIVILIRYLLDIFPQSI